MLEKVLSSYNINAAATIHPYGTGLINRTWKVCNHSQDYILQKINHEIFKNPLDISGNVRSIAAALEKSHPEYFFVAPVRTSNGETMLHLPGEGYFRLFPFVKDSCTYDVAQTPELAFEAAKQFGLFTKMLTGFPAEDLKITLPHFHDLTRRYSQFEQALQQGNPLRIQEAKDIIDFLRSHNHIVSTYREIEQNKEFRLRVTHHDTKISNVLFNGQQKGLCVIDLDTVMPGYFISDAGDMMRTYLSPVSEEEQDSDRIMIREDYFHAIAAGYLGEMGAELTETEIRHFVYAGIFMIYMQALRFLTDYLNNDSYYGALYDGHNYVRAKNQAKLLERLMEKESRLNKVILSFKGVSINPFFSNESGSDFF